MGGGFLFSARAGSVAMALPPPPRGARMTRFVEIPPAGWFHAAAGLAPTDLLLHLAHPPPAAVPPALYLDHFVVSDREMEAILDALGEAHPAAPPPPPLDPLPVEAFDDLPERPAGSAPLPGAPRRPCLVCHDAPRPGARVAAYPECSHWICAPCARATDRWRAECPVCRKPSRAVPLVPDDLIRLYLEIGDPPAAP